ncbi:MAG: acetyl-CoA carboxylase biotin carboxyl carrier protein [Candidatus Rokuibacteriota bacterium]|nr:MAG: acetyl-CoA carboxylase biotin carboxyl carrier protein [Candidatus Rokubacteria bacterium]
MAVGRRRSGPGDGGAVELARRLGVLLSELGLSEIDVTVGGVRVRLQRGGAAALPTAGALAPAAALVPTERPVPAASEASGSMITIEAPMVGTFYRASSPTAEPYVHEGDLVKEGQILCIIEAMKLMNEIESKAAGRVMKIFVDNAHGVEYGQPLFLIDPAR